MGVPEMASKPRSSGFIPRTPGARDGFEQRLAVPRVRVFKRIAPLAERRTDAEVVGGV